MTVQNEPERNPAEEPGRKAAAVVLRYFLCFLALFLTAAFQMSFFGAARFSAVPDLLVCAVAALALFAGERTGAVCGIAAGVFFLALGGTGRWMPLFYFLIGYAVGISGASGFRRNLLSWIVTVIPVILLREAAGVIGLVYREGSIPLIPVLTSVLVPEACMTFVFSFPVYFVVWLCFRKR